MTTLAFVVALAVLSLAMVFAMVQYSRAYLDERDRSPERERWGTIYALLWVGIIGLLTAFAGRLDPMIVLVPAAFLGLHWVILRFGSALRDAALEDQRRASLEPAVERETGDEDAEEEAEEPPAPEPTFAQKLAAFVVRTLRWMVALAAVLMVIIVGESLAPLRRLDQAIAPQRLQWQIFLAVLLAGGFAMFMGGIIHLVLTSRSSDDGTFSFGEIQRAWREGTWRDSVRMRRFFVIAGGATLAIVASVSLAVVTASPGIKLLVILAAGYAVVRTLLARSRRLQ